MERIWSSTAFALVLLDGTTSENIRQSPGKMEPWCKIRQLTNRKAPVNHQTKSIKTMAMAHFFSETHDSVRRFRGLRVDLILSLNSDGYIACNILYHMDAFESEETRSLTSFMCLVLNYISTSVKSQTHILPGT